MGLKDAWVLRAIVPRDRPAAVELEAAWVQTQSSACSVHYSVQSDGRLSSSRAEHGGLGELGLRTASVTSACYRMSDEGSFFSLLYFYFLTVL